MLRKAFLILSGNAAISLLLLARNLIVARMIPVADYGVAATFSMAMAVVEMASALGLQQQIIQSKDGDDPRFQAALQGFQVFRGLISGTLLFVLAMPLAGFLGIPDVAWSYQLLALVPVANALVHFDIHRFNRQMNFVPMLVSGAVPAFLSLMLIWPLSHSLEDWRIMLWSILAQAILTPITSHFLAKRPYRLVWDRKIVTGALRFGWPLLVNALLLFLVFQGDKLIVGRVIGMEALAIFSMGVTLTLTPTLVLSKTAQNLFLPRLSQISHETDAGRAAFDLMSRAAVQAALLNGAVVILIVSLFGGQFISLVLGAKYAGLIPLLTAFAMLFGIRVFKAGPAVVALSRGFTANPMAANLPRVAALPMGWVLMQNNGSLQQLIWLGIAAETAGFVLSMVMVARRPGVDFGPIWPTGLAVMLFLSVGGNLVQFSDESGEWIGPLAKLLCFGLLLMTMRDMLSRLNPRGRL